MMKSVPPVTPVIFVMPVIEIKIMEHGTGQESFPVTPKAQSLIESVAQLRHLMAVPIGRCAAMLPELLHLLHEGMLFQRMKDFFKFTICLVRFHTHSVPQGDGAIKPENVNKSPHIVQKAGSTLKNHLKYKIGQKTTI